MKIKEIPFGTPIDDPDGYCIYTNGHVDPVAFVEAVKSMQASEVPNEARAEITVANVEHIRFRPLSPTEAKGSGLTWGVLETKDGGYPVTAVKL